MIGAISLIRRRDDVDTAQFARHWLNIHGPLVCRLPGLCNYAQSHVTAALTQAARAMAIDGFAELAFDSLAARAAAYGSPELTACDRDSPGFIGSVSRLTTDAETIIPRPDRPRLTKLVVLFALGASPDPAALARCGPSGLIWHHVLQQGRAPNSAVPELHCPVAALAELWVTDPVTMDMIGTEQAGVFSVIEHRFR